MSGSPDVRVGKVRRSFSAKADGWPSIRDTFELMSGCDSRLRDRALEIAGGTALDVADLGGGTGGLAAAIRNATSGTVAMVDASWEMLEAAADRIGLKCADREVKLLCTTADHVPVPDGRFDLVTAEFLLHHLPRPQAVLREMRRIARPGATVLAQVPGPVYQGLVREPGRRWRPAHWPQLADHDTDPLGRFDASMLEGLARDAGLEVCTSYLDSAIYRFHSFEGYLRFMDSTGAAGRLQGYVGSMPNWVQWLAGGWGGSAREVNMQFLTIEAVRA